MTSMPNARVARLGRVPRVGRVARLAMLAILCAPLGGLATVALAPQAEAQTRVIDRSTSNGGSLTGTVDRDGRYVTRAVTRTGPNGGSVDRSSTCRQGLRAGCIDRVSGTTADGRSFSREAAGFRGPRVRAGIVGGTRPDGTGFRRGAIHPRWR